MLVVRRYYLLDRLCVRVLCMCYLVGGEACLGALSMCGRHCSERGFTVCTRAERGRGRIDKSINVMVPPLRQQSNNLMHCRQTDRQTDRHWPPRARRAKLSIGAEGGRDLGGRAEEDRAMIGRHFPLLSFCSGASFTCVYLQPTLLKTCAVLGMTTFPKLREMRKTVWPGLLKKAGVLNVEKNVCIH